MIRVSDATAWEHCPRHVWFLLHPPPGEVLETDPFEALVKTMGEAHEAEVLANFETFVRAESVEHTQRLMTAATAVIYQPIFVDPALNMIGVPDFLILEGDEYRVADAKLALSLDKKRAIKAQLGTYRRLAKSELPARVFLGSGEAVEISLEDDAVAEVFISDMQRLQNADEQPDTHYTYSKCAPCPFNEWCLSEFKRVDELTLNPAIQARAAAGLREQGINTLTALAAHEASSVSDVPYLKGTANKERAILQARSLQSGAVYPVHDVCLTPGDYIHFDVESDPMARAGAGEVYLWGFLVPPYGTSSFEYVWKTDDEAGDQIAWQKFLELIADYRRRFDDPRIVHYSHYEITQIRRYAERYGDEQHATIAWLLDDDGPMIDLQKIVKDALVLPVMSYGLKSICRDRRLVNFQWRLDESGSQWSVVRYYDYLSEASPAERSLIQQEILTYNEDDVRATEALMRWLSDRFT